MHQHGLEKSVMNRTINGRAALKIVGLVER